MTPSDNVSELYRIVSQLQVKAMLYVAAGADQSEKDKRAGEINEKLDKFIQENFSSFQSQGGCVPPCQWDDGLQMCICGGFFGRS